MGGFDHSKGIHQVRREGRQGQQPDAHQHLNLKFEGTHRRKEPLKGLRRVKEQEGKQQCVLS